MIEYRELTIEDIDAFAASCGFVHNGNFMQCKL